MAYKTPPGCGRSGSGAKPKEFMLCGSLSGELCYASILLADKQGISLEIFSKQEELVVQACSTLGALVAGIVGVVESQQAELLINIL